MLAKEIKPGTIVTYADAPCVIESVNVQSPSARGAATLYKVRARTLATKQQVDITLKGTESLELADFERRPIKYMYADATHMHFLDQTDYNQISFPHADVAEEAKYLTEELEGVQALFHNDECIGIQLPLTVELTITACDRSSKGTPPPAAPSPQRWKPAW